MDSSRGRVVLGSPCKLSLTLSLFSDAAAADDDQGSHLDSNSNQTTAFDQTNNHTLDISRFMKRRRQLELGTEQEEDENEVDRVCSRNSDDGSNSNARKKLSLTKAQSALLEESFRHHPTLNLEQKQELARDLKLRPRQVEVWFQNRRARSKLKQTETNYEFLKKYCDKLTEENRWLHKELEIMRLPQQQQQQPVHTMATMCPCCRRIAISPKEVGQSRNSANASGIFSMPLKHPHSSN